MRAAPALHQVREVVLDLPARLGAHLRVAAAADGDRRVGEDRRAQRQPRREVAGRPVAVAVGRRRPRTSRTRTGSGRRSARERSSPRCGPSTADLRGTREVEAGARRRSVPPAVMIGRYSSSAP